MPDNPPLDENAELKAWAVSTMVRWNDVLRPIIKQLVVHTPENERDGTQDALT
ncbi:hypothetical protein BH24CHL5_BH24CHL5_06110 [soil metagenome]